jgi:hypothetical protein
MSTAEKCSICFDPMPNDTTPAMVTGRRKCMDGTLKAVEHVGVSTHHYFKSLIVLIPADFTLGHLFTSIPESCIKCELSLQSIPLSWAKVCYHGDYVFLR